jgi:hypothetical protein
LSGAEARKPRSKAVRRESAVTAHRPAPPKKPGTEKDRKKTFLGKNSDREAMSHSL